MKKRRWRCFASGTLLLVLIAVSIWLLSLPRPRITKAVWEKLGAGMTLAEVEVLIEAPPGDYSLGFRNYDSGYARGFVSANLSRSHGSLNNFECTADLVSDYQSKMSEGRLVVWWGRNRLIIVEVDDRDIVQYVEFRRCSDRPEGWFAGLLWSVDQWLDGKD